MHTEKTDKGVVKEVVERRVSGALLFFLGVLTGMAIVGAAFLPTWSKLILLGIGILVSLACAIDRLIEQKREKRKQTRIWLSRHL